MSGTSSSSRRTSASTLKRAGAFAGWKAKRISFKWAVNQLLKDNDTCLK